MPIPAYMKITGATQGDMSAGASSADSIGALCRFWCACASQGVLFFAGY
jgi:hypothetical protein